MSVDEEYIRAMDEMFGRKPRPASAARGVSSWSGAGSVTAAVISKPKIVIATLSFVAGHSVVDEDRSGIFELEGRDSDAVRYLSCQLAAFFKRRRIHELALRASADSGYYTAHAHAMKIETILQLISSLEVSLHNTLSIMAWIKREDPPLPLGKPLGLGSRWEKTRDAAYETAFFAAARGSMITGETGAGAHG